MRQPSWAAIFMSRNAKAWKFKRALLQKENSCQAKTLWNIKFLWGLLSGATKTSEGKVIFNIGIWLRHMKSKNWSARHWQITIFSSTSSNTYLVHTLNSLSLFWLAESVQWIFKISAHDVITADYTIIMSRTLKVMGNHVMYDRGAWLLRVIMSSLHALCCLPSMKKQNHDFNFFRSMYMYNKTKLLLHSAFVISRIIKVSVRVISLGLRLQLITITVYLDLDYSGYHKSLIQ